MNSAVLLVGASVRAIAQSAHRAGYRPLALDLFGDVDLTTLAPTRIVSPAYTDVSPLARQFPEAPWCYTGGLENYPDLVEALSRERPLWGNPAATLRRVRDVDLLAACLRQGGFRFPEFRWELPSRRESGWLIKDVYSCGGTRVKPWEYLTTASPASSRGGQYWQRFQEGRVLGLSYLAGPSSCRLLGITEAIPASTEGSFHYAGAVFPAEPTAPTSLYERIGAYLAERFELRGLFGVDVIEDGSEVWVLEVNPRYTAGVELLERALRVPAFGVHVEACRGSEPTLDPTEAASAYCGKAILYADRDRRIGDAAWAWIAHSNKDAEWPRFADLPPRGTVVSAGRPMLTVFASAPTHHQTLAEISARKQTILNLCETLLK